MVRIPWNDPTRSGFASLRRNPSRVFLHAWVGAMLFAVTGCAMIVPGEVGVKQTLGKLDNRVYGPGPVLFTPGVTSVIRIPTRTVNLEVALELPSQEGLNIRSEISVLYRIEPGSAPSVISQIGLDYERVLVLTTFRSAAADVTARFMASDMYTSSRSEIEKAIVGRMSEVLAKRGFEIETVLLKSIRLPERLAKSVESKLSAEQDAERMTFILDAERQEAERMRIEAAGIRDSQNIVAESLSDDLLAWKSIQAFRELALSENAKVVVTNGNSPILIGAE